MREFVGVLVMVNGAAFGVYLLKEKSVNWIAFLAISSVFIFMGVAIANFPFITQLVVGSREGQGMSVTIERQVQHVDDKAKEVDAMTTEVKDLKDQVKLLVQNANDTNDKITASEKSVTTLVKTADQTKNQIQNINHHADQTLQAVNATEANVTVMRDNIRQTWQSLFESFAYLIGTRGVFPIPAAVQTEINKHMNILATFAWPDVNERQQEMNKVTAEIQAAMPKMRQRPR